MPNRGMSFWEEMFDEMRRDLEPANMLRGSQDFLTAWILLHRGKGDSVVFAGHEQFPFQATATCACMALELALKCRLRLDGKAPPKKHDFSVLVGALSTEAQEELAAEVRIDERPTDAAGLLRALAECDKTFETWRYLHEHDSADFYEPRIIDTTRALHAIVLRSNPTWQPSDVKPVHLLVAHGGRLHG
jgi:hypothetical protein